MVYIEAILSRCDKHQAFRIDADDMKELMVKAKKMIKHMHYDDGVFDIVVFDSNVLNIDYFVKLMKR